MLHGKVGTGGDSEGGPHGEGISTLSKDGGDEGRGARIQDNEIYNEAQRHCQRRIDDQHDYYGAAI
jgi:hypothetical protein